MIALIDGDIILWRVGRTTDNDPEWVAAARAEEMLDNILTKTSASGFQVFLSDSRENNFRWQLWQGYKANRPPDKPTHYDFLKELMLSKWKARIAFGMEADDALGISQVDSLYAFDPDPRYWHQPKHLDTVICSIDKDLLQIPGNHYNFVNDEFKCITWYEGMLHFYRQMLVGDKSDNIRGCRGIGPVKAAKALDGTYDPDAEILDQEEILSRIFDLYLKQEDSMSSEEILQHMLLVGRLLKIKQQDGEGIWHFPQSQVTQESFA